MWKYTCLLMCCVLSLKSCISNCPSSPMIWPRNHPRTTASPSTSTPARTSSPRRWTSSRPPSGRISWTVFMRRTKRSSSRRPWGAEWCVESLRVARALPSPVSYWYAVDYRRTTSSTERRMMSKETWRSLASPNWSTEACTKMRIRYMM